MNFDWTPTDKMHKFMYNYSITQNIEGMCMFPGEVLYKVRIVRAAVNESVCVIV